MYGNPDLYGSPANPAGFGTPGVDCPIPGADQYGLDDDQYGVSTWFDLIWAVPFRKARMKLLAKKFDKLYDKVCDKVDDGDVEKGRDIAGKTIDGAWRRLTRIKGADEYLKSAHADIYEKMEALDSFAKGEIDDPREFGETNEAQAAALGLDASTTLLMGRRRRPPPPWWMTQNRPYTTAGVRHGPGMRGGAGMRSLPPAGGARMAAMARGPMRPARFRGLEDEEDYGTLRMDAGEFGLSNDLLRDDLFADFDQELEDIFGGLEVVSESQIRREEGAQRLNRSVASRKRLGGHAYGALEEDDIFGTLRIDAGDFLVSGADVENEISRDELFGGLYDDDPDLMNEDLEPLDEPAPRRAVVTGASSEAPHRGFFYKLFHRDISKRIARLQDKLKRQIETGRVEEAYSTRGKIEEAMRTYKAMGQLASASEAEGVFEYRSPIYDS